MKLIKILFNRRCLLCGKSTINDYPLCQLCEKKISIIEKPICRQCGIPLVGEKDLCTKCRNVEFSFRTNRSLFQYRDVNRIVLHHYKFQKNIDLSRFFAKSILFSFDAYKEDTILIPVPTSYRKRKEKGWDQVAEVAKILGKRGGWVVRNYLGKLDTTAQKELDFCKRQENLRGKFYFKKGGNVEGVSCLLFDDVYTTGATIESCAKILKKFGAKSVDAITLFRD